VLCCCRNFGKVKPINVILSGLTLASSELNTYNKFDPNSRFGGYKESDFGREGGLQGLAAYCRLD
jgi:acyl-CoA reductase-like NAD-dependent aldehyde dehydrogenase